MKNEFRVEDLDLIFYLTCIEIYKHMHTKKLQNVKLVGVSHVDSNLKHSHMNPIKMNARKKNNI